MMGADPATWGPPLEEGSAEVLEFNPEELEAPQEE
jgi:hypothetical protein